MTTPIHVNYVARLMKARTRNMLSAFLYRFYTPFAFVIWATVALHIDTCNNVPMLIILVSTIAAIYNCMETYEKWRTDIYLIMEENVELSTNVKVSIVVSDFIVHFMCIVLSFWWIDDIHTCVPLTRYNQGWVWTLLLFLAVSLHIIQYRVKNKRLEHISRLAYSHVDKSDEV